METLEIQLLDKWFKTIDQKQRLYKRKWWPNLNEAKNIAAHCNKDQPLWFMDIGTGNGVTASYVAAMGFRVVTFDPVDRPKVYLDETFPLRNLHKLITFVNQPIEDSMNYWISSDKIVWSIAGFSGEKSKAAYLRTIRRIGNKGDLIFLNGAIERI